MDSFTYDWEQVDSSNEKLNNLKDNCDYLQEYPTPFKITRGNVGNEIIELGGVVKNLKSEMDRVADSFSSFLSKAEITIESLEDKMINEIENGS